ncbi:hypothetical protein Kpol_354p2 [Vanderwaltozyma polyspora DSM 70294]|uniref:Protein ECM9 n=1 Tax=Vanderwaltozyma polyspora (strain ATCC 22028 / DSM 70294 / BCRC 21397 / CBS 2163 / NBRC 10782 / NRRL Y-8283 / UCD 57-17) TaxID=436907 RepID=A7TSJ6_VANPO|nr:uncharacterized protein Kpol_354p2 [Vanderwaltozyma polyspora DSM 70294]EDO14754.1 hypothetical protein Kpol_354p2 [Vanderwaltozyma polyspora DSM 70294]
MVLPDSNELILCKEFYEILVANNEKSTKLTIAPNQQGIDTNYYIAADPTGVEIICFKSTFFKIFKEAHHYLRDSENWHKNPKPIGIFYATIGLLLTTPENKTILNIHEEIFWDELENNSFQLSHIVQNEIILIERLLTASNNKLNKSSSLWSYYKKLYSILKTDNMDSFNISQTILYSGRRHISNYYCWNASRWFFDICEKEVKSNLYLNAKEYCFANVSDCSSWSALSYYICQNQLQNQTNYEEYERILSMHSIKPSGQLKKHFPIICNVETFLDELINFIDKVQLKDWPPFLCLITIFENYKYISSLSIITKWEKELKEFEEKHGVINLVRLHPIIPNALLGDAIMDNLFLHLGSKKRAINSLKRNIKANNKKD